MNTSRNPTASKVEVHTSMFEFSHGKKPAGRGVWYFEIEGEQFWFSGTYGECKKHAVSKAVELGSWDVKVLS